MKIQTKLLTGILCIALLCGIVGTVGISLMSRQSKTLVNIRDVTIPSIEYLSAIVREYITIKETIKNLGNPLSFSIPGFYDKQMAAIQTARGVYRPAMEAYEKVMRNTEEQALWDKVTGQLNIAAAYTNKSLELALAVQGLTSQEEIDAGYVRLFEHIYGDSQYDLDILIVYINDLISYSQHLHGKVEIDADVKAAQTGSALLIGVTIIAFLSATIIGIFLGTSISRPLRKSAYLLDKIANGDISERFSVTSKDEFKLVAASLNKVIENIGFLIKETEMLSQAAVSGNLSVRGNSENFQGGYQSIVKGMNETLDAVIGPLNVAADYVEKISKGDIPQKITDSYNGDFNLIKNNLNVCIDAVGALVADANMLTDAAVAGALQTRADGTRHQGDYRKIVDGVNKTLDLVVGPINETIAVMKRLAEGDLTLRITGDYKGDFDVLKKALNDSLDSINDTLGQINIAVDQVAEGAVQVSQASQSLSQGASEQASSLEEITSSSTEISSQTKQNTENAVKVNSLAQEAQENAEKGNSQMKELVNAMNDINSSAEEIKKVVNTIDDISFQINLLALNANVEAARAGKYGKGFAVVAEEVRNLAVRSAESVKDTTRMVGETIANIQKGNALVEGTAKQLDEIVGGAAQVVSLAEEVAVAGREQTQGLEQISLGLNQIDQVTQSNTASAEESASASEELSSQAQQVKSMLSRFRLKASENKVNNAELMAMVRAELAAREGKATRKPA